MTFEEIEGCFPDGLYVNGDGTLEVSAKWLHGFAHNVAEKEREACANLAEYFEDDMGHGKAQKIADKIRVRSNEI